MAFSPPSTGNQDGDIYVYEGRQYIYSSAKNSWSKFGGGPGSAYTSKSDSPVNGELFVDPGSNILEFYDQAGGAWKGVSSNSDWSVVTNTPTSLSGYGITDAYTKTEVDTQVTNAIATASDFNNATNKPTDIAGYGITDAYTKTEVDAQIVSAKDFANATNKPTTLAGYGITDAYTKPVVDQLLLLPSTSAQIIDVTGGGNADLEATNFSLFLVKTNGSTTISLVNPLLPSEATVVVYNFGGGSPCFFSGSFNFTSDIEARGTSQEFSKYAKSVHKVISIDGSVLWTPIGFRIE